ncbi:hypothetical protein, conserved [Eimeria maxima]|uniref:Uncharacterized protein n=1 Tax=Eimeria maxima TaxID=5804 RepID=U6M5K7_EIMMA|nr:hypothetical protein, conserved [Eimeria maxima]CDJ58348.1 hypothetical protein, conserved [Eimeria maxima]
METQGNKRQGPRAAARAAAQAAAGGGGDKNFTTAAAGAAAATAAAAAATTWYLGLWYSRQRDPAVPSSLLSVSLSRFAAASFRLHTLIGGAKKCGEGRLGEVHHGSWRTLERWAEAQGLGIEEALRRYHQQTYSPSGVTLAVLDPRPLEFIEADVGPALQYLLSTPAAAAAAAGDNGETVQQQVSPPPEETVGEGPSIGDDTKKEETGTVTEEEGGGGTREETDKKEEGGEETKGDNKQETAANACKTPVIHYLECASEQQNVIAFFSFFLPSASSSSAAAAAAAAEEGSEERGGGGEEEEEEKEEDPVSLMLQARRLLVELALKESPPGDWFVREQQHLFAYRHVFFFPQDILQAAVDLAIGGPKLSIQSQGGDTPVYSSSSSSTSISITSSSTTTSSSGSSKITNNPIAAGQQNSSSKGSSSNGRGGRQKRGGGSAAPLLAAPPPSQAAAAAAAAAGAAGYKYLSFPMHHPCYNKCSVLLQKGDDPNDPRASVVLQLSCWVGQQLVPREDAAAELFLSIVKQQAQGVIEEAARAGIAAAISGGTFAAESHNSLLRRGDTIVVSVAGPFDGLLRVLPALLLPLSPSPSASSSGGAGGAGSSVSPSSSSSSSSSSAAAAAAAAAGATIADISDNTVSIANKLLLSMLQQPSSSPELLLNEMALDMLVFPQSSKIYIQQQLIRAPIDTRLAAAWRDTLWQSMALHATIEGNVTEESAINLISLVLRTLRPVSLHPVSEVLPSQIVDLRGIYMLAPPAPPVPTGSLFGSSSSSSSSNGSNGSSDSSNQRIPPAALYVHPSFSKTAFHAVRVYIQILIISYPCMHANLHANACMLCTVGSNGEQPEVSKCSSSSSSSRSSR